MGSSPIGLPIHLARSPFLIFCTSFDQTELFMKIALGGSDFFIEDEKVEIISAFEKRLPIPILKNKGFSQ